MYFRHYFGDKFLVYLRHPFGNGVIDMDHTFVEIAPQCLFSLCVFANLVPNSVVHLTFYVKSFHLDLDKQNP